MALRHKRFSFIFLMLLVAGGIFLMLPIELPFKVRTRAIIRPVTEWELSRTAEGNLTQTFRDNLTGTVRSYGVTEFQRGDVVRFEVSPRLQSMVSISKGDTVGMLYSNEEQRKLMELEGDLKVLRAERVFHTTGQKPEDVEHAERELHLAKQELMTQQKLTARSQVLLRDSVIPLQQYEIDLNELKVRELAVSIAEARLMSITTGEKPEQAELIDAKVQAITWQIDQLRARISYFTLLAPISGMVVMDRFMDGSERLVMIADTSAMVAVAPVRMSDVGHLRRGDRVRTIPVNGNVSVTGTVRDIDNVARPVDRHSAVFITAVLDSSTGIVPGSVENLEVIGHPLTPMQYAVKLLNSPQ